MATRRPAPTDWFIVRADGTCTGAVSTAAGTARAGEPPGGIWRGTKWRIPRRVARPEGEILPHDALRSWPIYSLCIHTEICTVNCASQIVQKHQQYRKNSTPVQHTGTAGLV